MDNCKVRNFSVFTEIIPVIISAHFDVSGLLEHKDTNFDQSK